MIVATSRSGLRLGSIPFAFYLAKYILDVDVRDYGPDGNPGVRVGSHAGLWPARSVRGDLRGIRRLQTADAWATVMGQLGLLAFLLVSAAEPYLLAVWMVQGAVVIWKHRTQLRRVPRLRSFDIG